MFDEINIIYYYYYKWFYCQIKLIKSVILRYDLWLLAIRIRKRYITQFMHEKWSAVFLEYNILICINNIIFFCHKVQVTHTHNCK